MFTTRPQELEQELRRSRSRRDQGLELEYLWPLHPLVEWLVDRGLATFGRHEAPVLQLTSGLEIGEVLMVLLGTIPNRSGQPVIQERVFESHQRYVEDVMTTEEAPYLKLVAVLHRPAP